MDPKPKMPTWREMNRDTSPEVEEMLLAYWRDTPGWEKLERVGDLNQAMRQLALAGLRYRHPDASPELLRRLLADILLGPELAERAYGPIPDSEA